MSEKFEGAPHVTVRLAPQLLELVQQHGGSPWVRTLIENALALTWFPTDRDAFFTHVSKVVAGAIRNVSKEHGDVVKHASSVGKRVASQLWAELHPGERQAAEAEKRALLGDQAREAVAAIERQHGAEVAVRAAALAERHPRLVQAVAAGKKTIEEAEAAAAKTGAP